MLTLGQLSPEEVRKELIHTFEAGQHAYVHLSLFGIDISITKAVVFLWIGAAVTFLIMFVGSRVMKNRPGAYEVLVEEMDGFGGNSLAGQMGEEGKKFFPYTLTLVVFLLRSEE